MKTTILALACFISNTIAPVFSQEEQTPAEKLVEMTNSKNMAVETAKGMTAGSIQAMRDQGLPEETLEGVSEAMVNFFVEVYKDPELNKNIAGLYSENFSDEEINELILFYQTPTGKKTLTTMPKIMQQTAVLAQKSAMKNQAELQKQIQAIMAKHQKKPESEKAGAPAVSE